MTQTALARRGTAERNVRDAHRFLDLLAAHDLDGAVDMFADDAELQAPFSPAGLPTGAVRRDAIVVPFRQICDNDGRVDS
jgi:ketosteroid isomerase-like protein